MQRGNGKTRTRWGKPGCRISCGLQKAALACRLIPQFSGRYATRSETSGWPVRVPAAMRSLIRLHWLWSRPQTSSPCGSFRTYHVSRFVELGRLTRSRRGTVRGPDTLSLAFQSRQALESSANPRGKPKLNLMFRYLFSIDTGLPVLVMPLLFTLTETFSSTPLKLLSPLFRSTHFWRYPHDV